MANERANPTTLGPSLFALAEAAEQHKRMLALHDLLLRLWHHHLGLSRQGGAYNAQFASELAYHLGYRDKP